MRGIHLTSRYGLSSMSAPVVLHRGTTRQPLWQATIFCVLKKKKHFKASCFAFSKLFLKKNFWLILLWFYISLAQADALLFASFGHGYGLFKYITLLPAASHTCSLKTPVESLWTDSAHLLPGPYLHNVQHSILFVATFNFLISSFS